MRFNGATVGVKATDIPVGSPVLWSVRPELVAVSPVEASVSGGESIALVGTLTDVADSGTAYDLFLTLGHGVEMVARTWAAPDVAVGVTCAVALAPEAIAIWPAPDVAMMPIGLTP